MGLKFSDGPRGSQKTTKEYSNNSRHKQTNGFNKSNGKIEDSCKIQGQAQIHDLIGDFGYYQFLIFMFKILIGYVLRVTRSIANRRAVDELQCNLANLIIDFR